MWGKLIFVFFLYALISASSQMHSKGWDMTFVWVFLFLLLLVWVQTRFHRVADGTAVVFEKFNLFKPWEKKRLLVHSGTHFTIPYVYDVGRNSNGDCIVVPTSEPRLVTIKGVHSRTKKKDLDITCDVIFSFRYADRKEGGEWPQGNEDPEEHIRIDIEGAITKELAETNLGNLRPGILRLRLGEVVSKHVSSEAKGKKSDSECYRGGVTVSNICVLNVKYIWGGLLEGNRILDDIWGTNGKDDLKREEEEGKEEEKKE